MESDSNREKQAVRSAMKRIRSEIPPHVKGRASRIIAHSVLGMWELDRAKLIAAYLANSQEVDCAPIVEVMWFRGVSVAYPRVNEPVGLSLHIVSEPSMLVTGSFGLLEPSADAPLVYPEDLDAIIVPGVAFDERGFRVGYGGGYYDRLLKSVRGDCARIGLAFDEQVMPELPTDDHDERVHVIVTPTRIIRCMDIPHA
ncbi:MAG: 5-formyltetrahydrofolate cyclo-ligase [Coriobacteriia bacterium]